MPLNIFDYILLTILAIGVTGAFYSCFMNRKSGNVCQSNCSYCSLKIQSKCSKPKADADSCS
jgi:2-iminoacetate synthase ThiH